jgi:hypothetical protein
MRMSIATALLAASIMGSIEAQTQKTADQAAADYSSCLKRYAELLAIETHEPADVVARASLSACPAERKAFIDTNRRYKEDWNDGAVKTTGQTLFQRLLSEVVQIRARLQ